MKPYTFTSFEHIVIFVLSSFLNPSIQLLNVCKGDYKKYIYFGFKKISEGSKHYHVIREKVDDEHRRIYYKALDLSEQVGSEERMLRIIRGCSQDLIPVSLHIVNTGG